MTIGRTTEHALTRQAFKVVGALKSLSAKNTTGAGTAFDLGGAFNTFAVQIQCATGGSTKAVVALQGSIDGTHYSSLGATVNASTASTITKSTSSVLVTHVRLNINSFSTLASTSLADRVAVTGWIATL